MSANMISVRNAGSSPTPQPSVQSNGEEEPEEPSFLSVRLAIFSYFAIGVYSIGQTSKWVFARLGLNQPSSFLQPHKCFKKIWTCKNGQMVPNEEKFGPCPLNVLALCKIDSNICPPEGAFCHENHEFIEDSCAQTYKDVQSAVISHWMNSAKTLAAQALVQELLRFGSKKISKQLNPTNAKRFEAVSTIARVLLSASLGTFLYAQDYGIGEGKGLWTTADLISEFSCRLFVSIAGETGGLNGYLLAASIIYLPELSGVKVKPERFSESGVYREVKVCKN